MIPTRYNIISPTSSFIKDDQIPALRPGQALNHMGAPGKIKRNDTLVRKLPSATPPGVQRRPINQIKGFIELFGHFALPLWGQIGRRSHNEGPGDYAAEFHLFEQQTGHDGFARAGIIGQQEAQARLLKHVIVNGLQLVWQGVDAGDTDRKLGVIGVG